MNIFIYNKTLDQTEYIGKYPEKPIPQIGGRVDFGYNPAPTVIAVAYSFETNKIYVIVK